MRYAAKESQGEGTMARAVEGRKALMMPGWIAGHPLLRAPLLVLTLAAVIIVVAVVDLAPVVNENFFFASDDPAFRMDARIAEAFPPQPQVIVSVAGDLHDDAYYAKVARLTRSLDDVPGVDRVQSVTRGPRNVSDAFEGPFWRRLLIGEDGRSTLLIVLLSQEEGSSGAPRTRMIEAIEDVAKNASGLSFEVAVSGVPYVVEMIRRQLKEDMIVFSAAAVVVFSLIILFVFRSAELLVGMLASCLLACALTLAALDVSGIRPGILTANLITIVFIMTLQHTVYLGFNIRTAAASGSGRAAVLETMALTAGASWWGMVTTLAGFLSLLLVAARPLRELGLSGGVGACLAFACAYAVFPSFLHGVRAPAPPSSKPAADRGTAFFTRPHPYFAALIFAAAALFAPDARRIDTDPSLPSYFSESSEIRRGLDYIDRNGGSSPLLITVSDAHGMSLDRDSAYEKLWSLQSALEDQPTVGSVLSLPLIMAEAKEQRFAFLFNYKFLLKRMEDPKYGRITNAFVTSDRKRTLLYLRMKENAPREHRLDEVEKIEAIVQRHGFRVEQVGGLYYLQGRFSTLIRESLFSGILQLIAFFLVVAAIVSRRFRWTLAMVVTLCMVPALVLGGIGILHVPVDIASAPAVNISVAMGIADMIQLTTMARRLKRRGLSPGASWSLALELLWKPAAVTSVAVSAGFLIFLLSNFPPTRRFGLAVVAGTAFALYGSLIVLPALAAAGTAGFGRDGESEKA